MNRPPGAARAGEKSEAVAQYWLWERSFELAVSVFKIADRIPRELGLALGGQMRLAALSIPSHLSLAKSRSSAREFANGLGVAVAALADLETQIALCCELGYATESEERGLLQRIRKLKRTATRLLRRLRGLLSENRLQGIPEAIAVLISEERDAPRAGRV